MGLVIRNKEARKAGNITLYPYKDVEEFPEYVDDDGKMCKISDEWKDVGFVLPRLTVERAEHVDNKGLVTRQHKDAKGARFTHTTYEISRVMHYFTTGGFIKDWVDVVDDTGAPIAYDKDMQEWLRAEFNEKGWLFGRLYDAWKDTVKLAEDKRRDSEGNFIDT